MKKVIRFLDLKFEETFLVGDMLAMTLIIAYQVIMRKVFNNSQTWTEEIARFLFIWQCWIGVAYAARISRHIRVDVLKDLLKSPKAKKALDVICLVCCVLFFGFLGIKGVKVVSKIQKMHQLSPACQIPMWIPYLAVPVGALLASLRFLQQLILLLTGKKDEPAPAPAAEKEAKE